MLGLRFCARLSLVAASGGHSSSWCAGLSLSWPLLLRSTGSRCAGSVVVAHGPSCSAACGIFPDQGSNPCPLHWQADSQPLRHQGNPPYAFLTRFEEIKDSVLFSTFSSTFLSIVKDCLTLLVIISKFKRSNPPWAFLVHSAPWESVHGPEKFSIFIVLNLQPSPSNLFTLSVYNISFYRMYPLDSYFPP